MLRKVASFWLLHCCISYVNVVSLKKNDLLKLVEISSFLGINWMQSIHLFFWVFHVVVFFFLNPFFVFALLEKNVESLIKVQMNYLISYKWDWYFQSSWRDDLPCGFGLFFCFGGFTHSTWSHRKACCHYALQGLFYCHIFIISWRVSPSDFFKIYFTRHIKCNIYYMHNKNILLQWRFFLHESL